MVDRWRVRAEAVGVAEISEQLLIAEVERRLTSKYAQMISLDQISTAVQKAWARFEHSRIRDSVPLLVERRARAELAKLSEFVAPSP